MCKYTKKILLNTQTEILQHINRYSQTHKKVPSNTNRYPQTQTNILKHTDRYLQTHKQISSNTKTDFLKHTNRFPQTQKQISSNTKTDILKHKNIFPQTQKQRSQNKCILKHKHYRTINYPRPKGFKWSKSVNLLKHI